ncbi:MAG: helix-turn-helix transcriptional regulator [Sphingosinicella sp.]|nr:helix-turn-helix transcriptional regulator [Sphingosinicella sp.]
MKAYDHPAIDQVAIENVLHALSDPLRLGIVRQLEAEGQASCNALDQGRPKSSMSHHFRVLRGAGLVRTRAEGTQHINVLRREELDRRFPGLLDAVLADAKGPSTARR